MAEQRKLKVLIVEDSEENASKIIRELKRGGYDPVFKQVKNEADMRAAMEKKVWDIIISNHAMIRFSGLVAIEVCSKKESFIPLMVFSETASGGIMAKTMKPGPHDYAPGDKQAHLVTAVKRELRAVIIREERKEAENKLKNALAFQQQLIDALPLPVVYKDDRGRYLGCNLSFEQFYGVKRNAIVGQKALDFFPKGGGDTNSKNGQALLSGSGMEAHEALVEDGYGGMHNVIYCKAPFQASHGSDGGFIEVLHDITERKQAEEALRKSEESYRNIYENAMVGIFQSTPEGTYLRVNSTLAKMHGFSSPEEMIRTVTNIGEQLYVNTEDRARYMKLLDQADTIRGFEAQLYRKDKSKIWISMNVRVIRDKDGSIAYYEGIVEDATERRKTEEALRASAKKLRRNLVGTIQVISLILEARDPYTAGHQKRVSNLARKIARDMGLPGDTIDNIRMAGSIHDIGKISVPAEILAKPTTLTSIEMQLIRVHPQVGFDILKGVEMPPQIAEIIFQHHERLDGSGYPLGLKNGEILFEAQILSVADVVEAMASRRPYRPALGLNTALEEIEKEKGILYNPEIADACIRLFKEKRFQFSLS